MSPGTHLGNKQDRIRLFKDVMHGGHSILLFKF